MADTRNEPSMEDILASIKRIIADDTQAVTVPRGEPAARGSDARRSLHLVDGVLPTENADDEEVLELTQPIDPFEAPSTSASDARAGFKSLRESIRMSESAVAEARAERPRVETPASSTILSDDAATASRQSLAALSALIVKPEDGVDNTLDGLVREMLRPMLKEWLDQRLPELVEKLVEKEIARITGRAI